VYRCQKSAETRTNSPRRVEIDRLLLQEFSTPFRFRLPGGSITPVARFTRNDSGLATCVFILYPNTSVAKALTVVWVRNLSDCEMAGRNCSSVVSDFCRSSYETPFAQV